MTFIDNDDVEVFTTPAPIYSFVLSDVPQPGPWHRHAACRTAPPSLFFPERGDPTAPAKAICAKCPVLVECRAYALDAGPVLHGIWGGMSGRERQRLHRARSAA